MGKIIFLCMVMIALLVSCDKDEDINLNNELTIKGSWNRNIVERYNVEGELTSVESLDTMWLIKLSIGNSIIQEMMIDSALQFFYLMYESYEIENGILKRYPDSLIDIDMNKYYWNSEDSTFGSFPVRAYPIECSIEQSNNNEYIEHRVFDNDSIIMKYNRLNNLNIDLLIEFESINNNLKGLELCKNAKKLKNTNLETPVYNTIYSK